MLRAHRLILALGLLAAGCASYPDRMSRALDDFRSGHFEGALEVWGDASEVGSGFLSGAESGTVALAAGRWDEAQAHFQRAVDAARDIEGRALAGADRLGEGLATWALNDSAAAYQGEGFERVYVHACLALTYLAQGKLDDVYVEARLANELLAAEEELYEKSYAAGGFGHLISALAYELLGEADNAYIDYKRMVEKGVGTALAGPALVRLAKRLGRDDELPTWSDRFGATEARDPGGASVVVLAGVGLAPFKVQSQLTLPTDDGLFQLAVPGYQSRANPVRSLRLVERETGTDVLTDVVEDVSAVAEANLGDRVAWTAAKSTLRGLAKRELTKKLEEEYDVGGRVLGDLFTLLTERADLRSWLTLPATWQAARIWVPAGPQDLVLEAQGGEGLYLGTYGLEPGEALFVIARSVGPRLHAHVLGGEVLPDAKADPYMPPPAPRAPLTLDGK